MKILSLDSTGLVAGCAIVDEGKTVAEFTTNYKKTHSQTLMPMIGNMCKLVELDLKQIDYIACASGPGSFTGLRIGAATAKGLAHGLNKKIIPIPTLDALAYNIIGCGCIVVPIMDARRNQVYTALYDTSNGLKRLSEYMACDIDELLAKVSEQNNSAIFLGDGVPVFEDKITSASEEYKFAPPSCNMQRAASVGALALERIEYAVDCDDFEIMYLRKSQAEREREEQQRGNI